MARKGENIYKRKDGRWEARYIKFHDENGRTKYGYVYAKTYKEARKKRVEQMKSMQLLQREKISEKISFQRVSMEWLEYVSINIKESSYVRYKRIIDKYLMPFWGEFSVEEISDEQIEKYIKYLSEHGRADGKGGLSAKTIRDVLAVLKSIFIYAQKHNVEILCKMSEIRIKRKTNEIRVLTAGEQKKLVSYLLEDMDLIKMGILLSLYSGIRIGELCALKWENINLEEGSVEILHTLQRIENISQNSKRKTKIVITEPKSESSKRKIPLPDFMIALIRPNTGRSDEYILTGDSLHYIEPRTVQNHFYKIAEACGLKDINFHALRHTFATRSVELGFEIKSLSEILGHSNINITLEKYVHSSFNLKKENMEKLSKVF